MALVFIEIYFLGLVAFFILLFSEFADYIRAGEDLRLIIPLCGVIELIIVGIINAVWLRQPFWTSVFLPIVITASLLVLIINLSMWWDAEVWSRSQIAWFKNRSWYQELATWIWPLPDNFAKIFYLFLTLLLSSISFAILTFDSDYIRSIFNFRSTSPEILLNINKYTLLTSTLTLILMTSIYTIKRIAEGLRK